MTASTKPSLEAVPLGDVEKANPPPSLPPSEVPEEEEEENYPTGVKLWMIMLCLYLIMFIVALDRTIIGTAIPSITDEFNSLRDVGWYGSSYLLSASAFQLVYGRIYTFYSPKWILLGCIGIFELGSLVCAVAPSSTAFILGRAVAGLGCGGIFSGAIITMVASVPLHKRPMFQGVFGAVFGVASVAGPLLGGVFTTRLSWRWCFWINLPIGGAAAVVMLFILRPPPVKDTNSLRQRIKRLDPLGTLVFLPGIVCIILALQWGGATYAWSSWRIILLFILGIVLLIIFCIIQVYSGENATVPIRIIKQRSIISGMYFSLISPGGMFVMMFYLPIWFQSIKGVSAVRSGIDTLPLIISLVFGSITAGILTGRTGYYVGQLYACSILMSIGAGLLTTLKVSTNPPHWIGFQILFGYGLGLGMQQPGMAAQTCLAKKDVMTGVSLMFFMQGLGGSIWLSVAQTVFNHGLISNLKHVAITVDPRMIVRTGATNLRDIVPPESLNAVLVAYNAAITNTFKISVACAVAAILAAVSMEWRSVKAAKQAADKAALAKKNAAEQSSVEEAKVSSEPQEGKL